MAQDVVNEARKRLEIAISRGELGERRRDVHLILDYLASLENAVQYEWGIRWDGTETVAHSEAMARKWVEEDPDKTVLLKRVGPGPWIYA